MSEATEVLRSLVEVERPACLWGVRYTITPRLVDEVFGDGLLLVALEPLDHRPNYYVVRVDSSWHLSNWSRGDLFSDHLEQISLAVADQFGFCCCGDDGEACSFPRCHLHSGSAWWALKWPAEAVPA